jgi:PAS domain-containing protein
MQDLIKHLPAVIYEYAVHPNGDRQFNYISPSAETILGLKPEEVLKNYSALDAIIHVEDLPSLKDQRKVVTMVPSGTGRDVLLLMKKLSG